MWGDIMKKKMGLLLICCLMVLTPITSYAKSHDIEKNVVARKIEVIPKEVVEADFNRQINELLEQKREADKNKITPMAADHIYTAEVVEIKTKWVSGIPGGQPRNGTRFKQPGGFYYSPSGGPTATSNIEFSVPFKVVSFSVNLGTAEAATTGYTIRVPNTEDFFLLTVDNEVEIRQVNIYKQITPYSPKTLDSISYVSSVIRRVLDVVVVPM